MEPPPLLNICSMAYLQVKNMPRPSAAITSSQSYELALVWAYEKGQLLINVILGPVTEELYLRGYLLPRLYRFGIWAPLINISLFSLYLLDAVGCAVLDRHAVAQGLRSRPQRDRFP